VSELESVGHRSEIGSSIDQKFDARCLGDFPAITTFLEDCHRSKSNKVNREYHMDRDEAVINLKHCVRAGVKVAISRVFYG